MVIFEAIQTTNDNRHTLLQGTLLYLFCFVFFFVDFFDFLSLFTCAACNCCCQ